MSNEDWIAHAYPLQRVTIRLQGTRHSEKAAVISQLETVLARLKAGDAAGHDHDDDFGYAFEYVEAAPGPSFFDGPADTSLGKSTTSTPFNFEFDPKDNGHTLIFAPTRSVAGLVRRQHAW